MACAIPETDPVRPDKRFIEIVWEKFQEFFDREKHIDVTFLWRSHPKRVTAHRLILAAASDYFDKLFLTTKGSAPTIYINDIPPDAFELLIAYCYTGKLNPNTPNLVHLLDAARTWKLEGAVAICTAYLQRQTIGPCSGSQLTVFQPITINLLKESILAVRRCTEKEDTESYLYRCDETDKIWIQCGVLKFPNPCPNFVYTNKHLISLGGFSNNGFPTNEVYSYSLATEEWKKLPRMSISRAGVCVREFSDGVIYAFGGCSTNKGVALNTAEILRPNAGKWSSLPNMLYARTDATAVVSYYQIYVIGGRGSNGEALKSVERFNILSGEWEECADMITARFDCGASFFKDLLYVIGSGDTSPFLINSVECYNPRTNTWSQAAPVNVARHSICGITLSNRLMAIGGGATFKGVVEVFKPTQNSWLQVKPLQRNGSYRCFVVPTTELVELCGKPKTSSQCTTETLERRVNSP